MSSTTTKASVRVGCVQWRMRPFTSADDFLQQVELQARAVENECYVILAGSVGCMPEVASIDNQYAQSAIFTPSDFGFPHDAIVAEATANVETTLVADLDIARLKALRVSGSVRNAADRRRDLYRVEWLGKK